MLRILLHTFVAFAVFVLVKEFAGWAGVVLLGILVLVLVSVFQPRP